MLVGWNDRVDACREVRVLVHSGHATEAQRTRALAGSGQCPVVPFHMPNLYLCSWVKNGLTALMHASFGTEELLKYGAQVDAQDNVSTVHALGHSCVFLNVDGLTIDRDAVWMDGAHACYSARHIVRSGGAAKQPC